jgi:hypothetical protein
MSVELRQPRYPALTSEQTMNNKMAASGEDVQTPRTIVLFAKR